MAYGKGQHREAIKRVADLGDVPLVPDLVELRAGYLRTVRAMAQALWPADILDDVPDGKKVDAILLAVQSQASKAGFNNVWAEKARFSAKTAVLEQ